MPLLQHPTVQSLPPENKGVHLFTALHQTANRKLVCSQQLYWRGKKKYLGWVNDTLLHHIDILSVHSVIANFCWSLQDLLHH